MEFPDGGCCAPMPGRPFGEWLQRELLSKGFNCSEIELAEMGWKFIAQKNQLDVCVQLSFAAGELEDGSDTEWFISSEFLLPNILLKPSAIFRTGEGKALAEQVMREIKYSIGDNLEMEILRVQ